MRPSIPNNPMTMIWSKYCSVDLMRGVSTKPVLTKKAPVNRTMTREWSRPHHCTRCTNGLIAFNLNLPFPYMHLWLDRALVNLLHYWHTLFSTALSPTFAAMLINQFLNSDGDVDTSRMEQLFFQMSDPELEAVSVSLHQEQVRRLAEARAEAKAADQGSRPKEDAKQSIAKNATVVGTGAVNRSPARIRGTAGMQPQPLPLPPPPASENPYAYVSQYGECYHMHRNCVHLARSKTVARVPAPFHLRPCKTCSGHHIPLSARGNSI